MVTPTETSLGNVCSCYLHYFAVVPIRSTCTIIVRYNVAELSWNRIGRNGVQVETENKENAVMCSCSPQNRGRRIIKSYCFMTFSLLSSSYLLKLADVKHDGDRWLLFMICQVVSFAGVVHSNPTVHLKTLSKFRICFLNP